MPCVSLVFSQETKPNSCVNSEEMWQQLLTLLAQFGFWILSGRSQEASAMWVWPLEQLPSSVSGGGCWNAMERIPQVVCRHPTPWFYPCERQHYARLIITTSPCSHFAAQPESASHAGMGSRLRVGRWEVLPWKRPIFPGSGMHSTLGCIATRMHCRGS